MMKGSKTLGLNINKLLIMHDISQSKLAKDTGIDKALISQYVSGKLMPKQEKLEAIAKYFGVTTEMLLKDNFVVNGSIKVNMEKSIKGTVDLFPLFENDRTRKNAHFCVALAEQKKIFDHVIKQMHTLDDVDFDKIMGEYSEAVDDDSVGYEVVANELAFFMTLAMIHRENALLAPDYEALPIQLRKILDNDSEKKGFYNRHRDILEKSEDHFNGLVNDQDYQSMIMGLIGALKEDREWCDLADYYIAMLYVLGAVDNNFSFEQNQEFGQDLMLKFAQCDNVYAMKYFEVIQSIFE